MRNDFNCGDDLVFKYNVIVDFQGKWDTIISTPIGKHSVYLI